MLLKNQFDSAVHQGTNNSNLGMYGNDKGEGEPVADDMLIMNIPREGNADQLNKSTKITMSSKKKYENHIQNISLQ